LAYCTWRLPGHNWNSDGGYWIGSPELGKLNLDTGGKGQGCKLRRRTWTALVQSPASGVRSWAALLNQRRHAPATGPAPAREREQSMSSWLLLVCLFGTWLCGGAGVRFRDGRRWCPKRRAGKSTQWGKCTPSDSGFPFGVLGPGSVD